LRLGGQWPLPRQGPRRRPMKSFVKGCKKLGAWMNSIAGVAIFFMMGLTVADVALRFFGKPITGSYELMAVAGAIVIGMAIPKTSLDRGHIVVDMLVERGSARAQKAMFIVTRIPGIVLFAALTYYLIYKGYALYQSKEISLVLGIPYYPVVYLLAFCCIIECAVLVADIAGTSEAEGGVK
jgi:TRAP-type C4-dicarboxylate transport system permease small subunit